MRTATYILVSFQKKVGKVINIRDDYSSITAKRSNPYNYFQ